MRAEEQKAEEQERGRPSKKSTQERRMNAKEPDAEEQERVRPPKEIEKQKEALLVEYAKNLFIELNASVFEGRLSENTDLQWNKRLQSTAGRAEWRR